MKNIILMALCGLVFAVPYSAAQQQPRSGLSGNEAARPGPITKPIIIEIAPETYFINEFGMNAMYLVVGETRALVIDAGTGFCDLKGIVEGLTDLPYDVALTHGHPDFPRVEVDY